MEERKNNNTVPSPLSPGTLMGTLPQSSLSVLAADIADTVQVSEDFELPEYQPEVRKVLGIMHTVTRDNVFLESGENGMQAEVGGCVLYTLVYLGGDGQPSSVPLFSTYTTTLTLPPSITPAVRSDQLHIICEGENVSCRVSAPRKLNLSARVRVRCILLGETDCSTNMMSVSGDPSAAKGEPVLRWENLPFVRMKNHRYTGQIQGEVHESVGVTPVTCRGQVSLQNLRLLPDGTGVKAEGEAAVYILLRTPEGEYRTVRSRTPLSETIALPQSLSVSTPGRAMTMEDENAVTAYSCPAAVTLTGTEDGTIRWEMEYDLDLCLLQTEESRFATDGYSTRYRDNLNFASTDVVTKGQCIRGQVTVSGEKMIRREGEEEGPIRFLFGWGRGVFDKAEPQENDRTLLQGSAHCTVLLESGGEIKSEEVVLPIRYLWDSGMGPWDCRCVFPVWDVNGHMDGELLRLTAETAIQGPALYSQNRTWLQSFQEDPTAPLPPVRPSITLYVPDAEEDIWQVQKRFRTNDITENAGRYVVRIK